MEHNGHVEIRYLLDKDSLRGYLLKYADWTNSVLETRIVVAKKVTEKKIIEQHILVVDGAKKPAEFILREIEEQATDGTLTLTRSNTTPTNEVSMKDFQEFILRLSLTCKSTEFPAWKCTFMIEAKMTPSEAGNKGATVRAQLFPNLPTSTESFMVKAVFGKSYMLFTSADGDPDDIVSQIKPVKTDGLIEGLLLEIGKWIGKRDLRSIKRAGQQPVGLTKYAYQNHVLSGDFYLTEKADGIRSFFMVTRGNAYIVNSTAKMVKLKKQVLDNILIDAEVIDNHIFAFDILYYEQSMLDKLPFVKRLAILKSAVKKHGLPVMIKKFAKFNAENPKEQITESYEGKHPYAIDGLIFTENTGYYTGKTYKWKPPHLLTVDFVIRKPIPTQIGLTPVIEKPGMQIYLLFCGIRKEDAIRLNINRMKGYAELFPETRPDYYPIQFINNYVFYSKDTKLDHKVGEFELFEDNWKLVRIREDKQRDYDQRLYIGNDFITAAYTWNMIRNPLTYDELKDPSKGGMYFAKEKSDVHKPVTSYNSFIKTMLIEEIQPGDTVYEFAAGKGQDINRYFKRHIKTLVCIDKDPSAIEELNNRVLSSKLKHHATVKTHVLDLMAPYKTTLATLSAGEGEGANVCASCDFVVCNFAIHYLAGTTEALMNVLNLVNSLLKPGGKFIFTCFDGKTVYNELAGKQRIDYCDGEGSVKYSVEKRYEETGFTGVMQKIGVKLPFTAGEYYEEFLVNLDDVIDMFERKGFEVEKHASFSTYFDRFSTANPRVYADLTQEDKKFISLYSFVSLWKV